jgi:iron complex transport system ATP-binding protein
VTPLVEFRDVGFAYGTSGRPRDPRFRLRGISFAIESGEILGVVGPNSAGKTTLLRLMTRVLRPARGEVFLEGRPLGGLGYGDVARVVAVVPQEAPRPFRFTVEQLVLMGRYPHAPGRFFESALDLAVARDAMTATGVLELASVPVDELSGGERQRAMLARALAQEPRLLVLDEPTAHLDLRHQAEAAELLRRANGERALTIVIVSHDLVLAAELCDRLLLLGDGRIARHGAPADVLEAALLEEVFGAPMVVEKSQATGRPLVQVAWPATPSRRRDGRG